MVDAAPLALGEQLLPPPQHGVLLLAGPRTALTEQLAGIMRAHGAQVVCLYPADHTAREGEHAHGVAWEDAESILGLPERLGVGVAGLVHLGHPDAQGGAGCEALFLLLKAFAPAFEDRALQPWLVHVSFMGGRFGMHGAAEADLRAASRRLRAAGAYGVLKSAYREWPWAHVRLVDLSGTLDAHAAAQAAWRAAAVYGSDLEVGFDGHGYWGVSLKEAILSLNGHHLDQDSVILATGGGQGITALAATALARRYRPIVHIVGRTALTEEAGDVASCKDEAALRLLLTDKMRSETALPTPVMVEREVQAIIRQRALRTHLDTMRRSGARVWYHAVDVRDAQALRQAIEGIYRQHDRIDMLLHGAGILADRRIKDKTPQEFDSVLHTKADSALTLLQALRPEQLRFVMLFSSVVARFGNMGQADYAAANEILNKLAWFMASRWPHVRVSSIGWGPWDYGMVSEPLRRLYRERGIALLDPQEAVGWLLREITAAGPVPPEILITRSAQALQRGLFQ